MPAANAQQKLRFAMGMLQIAGVGFSLGIIVMQGLTALAVCAVIATTVLAIVSFLLFRRRSDSAAR